MLSNRHNTRAAYRFLRKALKTMGDYPPSSITTDKLASYPKAIRVGRDGHLWHHVQHRTSNYLDNFIEADHAVLKCMIQPACGLQRMKPASATIRGFEVMRMICRGHCALREPGRTVGIRLVDQPFGVAA